MNRNTVPEVDPVATASGVVLSVLVAILGVFLGFPGIAAIAGVFAGGYVAGRLARRDGLFHGAIVGVLAIILASFAASAGYDNATNILVDTGTIILGDVLLLSFASAGGWLSTRS